VFEHDPKLISAVADFEAAHGRTALTEGWLMSVCYGSECGPVQVQKVDSPDDVEDETGLSVPELEDDETAWRIVARNTAPHHAAALNVLQRFNPAEYARVLTA
jgi:hypothetical protein